MTVSLDPLPPKEKMVVCAHCNTLEGSFHANLIALKHNPAAVELMDGKILELSFQNIELKRNTTFIDGLPAAVLIAEFWADTREGIDTQAEAFEKAGGAGGGQYWQSGGGGSPFDGFDFSMFTNGGKGGFSSFFEQIFGRQGGSTSRRTGGGEMNATVNIDLYTALLGGEVILSLSNGSKVKLKVKPETQPGTKVRLKGKGFDRGDGTFGDLIITYQVKLPTNLTEHQRQLIRELQMSR